MNEPRWLTAFDVEVMHGEQLTLFGGPPGIRDRRFLASALDRPRNEWAYEGADLPELGAVYAFGIARNHPFVDGNKRAAFVAMMAFLRLNGIGFAPPSEQATAIILDLAAGLVSEDGLTRWIRDNWPPREPGVRRRTLRSSGPRSSPARSRS